MVVFDVVVEVPMDADEYLRVKDSAAYKAFHCEKNGTLNEYISDEVVDGDGVPSRRGAHSPLRANHHFWHGEGVWQGEWAMRKLGLGDWCVDSAPDAASVATFAIE